MDKIVVIVNGCGGVGKDTFCDLVGKYINCITVSSVHPIKEIARHAGWNGEKDDKSRKFLSDLKDACTEYRDLSMEYLKNAYHWFMSDELWYKGSHILFMHIREPKEIERAVKEFNAKTILVINENANKVSGNHADENVYDYQYDLIIENNGSLDDLDLCAKHFADLVKNDWEELYNKYN